YTPSNLRRPASRYILAGQTASAGSDRYANIDRAMDLEGLRGALAAQPAVKLAVVFGSAARGRSGSGSALDLALRLVPDTAAARREAVDAARRAARREIDTVDLD